MLLSFIFIRRYEDVNYRLIPHWKDLVMALLCLLFYGLTIVPIGLLTKFLKFPGDEKVTFINVSCTFLEIFFTVALTEEIIFRGVL